MSLYHLMPDDWNDIAGWDAYFEAVGADMAHLARDNLYFDTLMTLPFVQSLSPGMTVWFPGCGASIGPHLCAALGYDVWASDASSVAIDLQHDLFDLDLFDFINQPEVRAQLEQVERPGALHLFVHDFRQPLPGLRVDCVLNIKSFQGLPKDAMQAAAQTHYEALTPRGIAFVSTINVQGQRRDTIETTLIDAGFVVPFFKTNQWYRRVLDETGIPYVFILGRPMVRAGEDCYQGDAGHAQLAADHATIDGFGAEYEQRLLAERDSLQMLMETGADIRLCNVIYNTG